MAGKLQVGTASAAADVDVKVPDFKISQNLPVIAAQYDTDAARTGSFRRSQAETGKIFGISGSFFVVAGFQHGVKKPANPFLINRKIGFFPQCPEIIAADKRKCSVGGVKFYLRQLIDFLIEPGKNQFVFISADRCPIIKSGGKQPRSQQEQSSDAELEQRGVDTEFSAGSPGAAEKQIDGQSQQQNARKQIDVDQLDEVGNMLDVGVEFFAVGGEVKAQAVQLPAIVGDDGKFVGGKEISSFKAFFVPDFGELSLGLVYFFKDFAFFDSFLLPILF